MQQTFCKKAFKIFLSYFVVIADIKTSSDLTSESLYFRIAMIQDRK